MKGIFGLKPLRHFSTFFFYIFLAIVLDACGGGAGTTSTGTTSTGTTSTGTTSTGTTSTGTTSTGTTSTGTSGGSGAPLGATSCGVGSGNNADLVWNPPGTKTDGSTATAADIAGYVVYYGQTSRSYAVAIWINDPAASSCTIAGLSTGSYYFAVTVIDKNGNESAYSKEKIRSF